MASENKLSGESSNRPDPFATNSPAQQAIGSMAI